MGFWGFRLSLLLQVLVQQLRSLRALISGFRIRWLGIQVWIQGIPNPEPRWEDLRSRSPTLGGGGGAVRVPEKGCKTGFYMGLYKGAYRVKDLESRPPTWGPYNYWVLYRNPLTGPTFFWRILPKNLGPKS